jgi:hypothetical protein
MNGISTRASSLVNFLQNYFNTCLTTVARRRVSADTSAKLAESDLPAKRGPSPRIPKCVLGPRAKSLS